MKADKQGPGPSSRGRPFARSLPMQLMRARELVMRHFRPHLHDHDLTDQQWRIIRALTEAIKHAALRGIEVAMTHSVQVLMSSIYDLCTSKLESQPS